FRAMSHPDPVLYDRPLTRRQVRELHDSMSLLSPARLFGAYQRAHEQCRMTDANMPPASAVQQLVTAWKVMRERRIGRERR
ncbi:MAG TPA: hypothetical protein VMJ34_11445, partial [Bryobacteraceae bacterium]|nr:hypothetical protein [Bryobacteraceae bacterium]